MTTKTIQIISFLFTLIFFSFAPAQQGSGPPLQNIQNQINELQLQIEGLQQAVEPVEVTVNCSDESITDVLNTYANSSEYLTITVQGMCVENVVITRSKVLLKGDSANGTDSIQISDVNGTALHVNNANEIIVQDLDFKGNTNSATGPASVGIHCRENAAVTILGINVNGFGTGVFADGGGHCGITNSDVTNNQIGARVRNNGTLRIVASQITNYEWGIFSERGGFVTIINSDVFAFPSVSPTSVGMVSSSGGGIRAIRTKIETNDRGVLIQNFGIVSFNGFNGGTIIGNVGDAITCSGVFDLRGVGSVEINNNGDPSPGNLCPQPNPVAE